MLVIKKFLGTKCHEAVTVLILSLFRGMYQNRYTKRYKLLGERCTPMKIELKYLSPNGFYSIKKAS
jgi:hypothetical protein